MLVERGIFFKARLEATSDVSLEVVTPLTDSVITPAIISADCYLPYINNMVSDVTSMIYTRSEFGALHLLVSSNYANR